MITWFDVPKEGMSPGSKAIIPTGNIELTENGEGIDVSTYATATVNVSGGGGGGDFSTAEVTFSVVNEEANAAVGVILNSEEIVYTNGDAVIDGDKLIYVLYKGSQTVYAYDTAQITVEGSANITEQREDDGTWIATIEITGNCTIHLTGENFG